MWVDCLFPSHSSEVDTGSRQRLAPVRSAALGTCATFLFEDPSAIPLCTHPGTEQWGPGRGLLLIDTFSSSFLQEAVEYAVWTSGVGAQGNLARKSAPGGTHRNGCKEWVGRAGATKGKAWVQILSLHLTGGVTLGEPFNLLSLPVLVCQMGMMTVVVKMRMTMVLVAVVLVAM